MQDSVEREVENETIKVISQLPTQINQNDISPNNHSSLNNSKQEANRYSS